MIYMTNNVRTIFQTRVSLYKSCDLFAVNSRRSLSINIYQYINIYIYIYIYILIYIDIY